MTRKLRTEPCVSVLRATLAGKPPEGEHHGFTSIWDQKGA